MRRDWVGLCRTMAASEPEYYAGSKKLFRNQSWSFPDPLGPLTFEELGFTKVKMTVLKKSYIHEESRNSALNQWNNKNRSKKAHNSVSFHCFNHLLKSHSVDPSNKNSSVMGPCLQSVIISQTLKGTAEVNVFYRTTELFKKFPADLVLLRDYLLSDFDFSVVPLGRITFTAANLTVSPNYLLVPLGVSDDPHRFMEEIRLGDPRFHKYACSWILKLLTGGQQKFNQARRTQNAAKRLLTDEQQAFLIAYASRHHKE